MLAPAPGTQRPIEALAGQLLNGRWRLIKLLRRAQFQTGSCFSVGYVVEGDNGQRAYAKILDFSRALQEPDSAHALSVMTDSYIFERELLKLCAGERLTRIVRGLDYGEHNCSGVPLQKLFFIIFEIAAGDIRHYINSNGEGSISWRLRLVHDAAVGLHQLHRRNIYHQDLKPSNLLMFDSGRAKLADLGRAHCSSIPAPHDDYRRPGAFYYAPPEQIYDYHIPDRAAHRLSGDLYLLGSMLDFFITGRPTSVRLIDTLSDVHRPFPTQHNGWRGYFDDVIPHLQAAYSILVTEFKKAALHLIGSGELAAHITDLFIYATNPNPALRGHPNARRQTHLSPFDLERFVSGFDIVARRVEVHERVHAKRPT